MAEPQKMMSWLATLSPIQRTVLGMIAIALVVVIGMIYGPHYDTDNTTTGDSPAPTLTVKGLTSSLDVNHSIAYRGVTITVTRVMQAQSFSDDGKSQYGQEKYVLRIYLHVQAPKSQNGPLGLNYPELTRLILSNGTQLRSNLVQLSPDILPGQDEQGFLDFWTNTPLKLAQLALLLDGIPTAFGK